MTPASLLPSSREKRRRPNVCNSSVVSGCALGPRDTSQLAEMGWKLTQRSAFIFVIIDCNQHGAEQKARKSGSNKCLPAGSNRPGTKRVLTSENAHYKQRVTSALIYSEQYGFAFCAC